MCSQQLLEGSILPLCHRRELMGLLLQGRIHTKAILHTLAVWFVPCSETAVNADKKNIWLGFGGKLQTS